MYVWALKICNRVARLGEATTGTGSDRVSQLFLFPFFGFFSSPAFFLSSFVLCTQLLNVSPVLPRIVYDNRLAKPIPVPPSNPTLKDLAVTKNAPECVKSYTHRRWRRPCCWALISKTSHSVDIPRHSVFTVYRSISEETRWIVYASLFVWQTCWAPQHNTFGFLWISYVFVN